MRHETLGLVASGIVLVLTAVVLWTLNRYLGAMKTALGAGSRTRRLYKRRQDQMFAVVGLWEVSIGFLLIGAMGDITSGMGPVMVGLFFLFGAWFRPRLDQRLGDS